MASERHFCSYTFIEETEEVRLLRCSRCADTFYKDRGAQKAHWKIHKKVCAPVNEQERATCMSLDSSQVVRQMEGFTSLMPYSSGFIERQSLFSRKFLYLLQRLEVLCQEGGPLDEDFEEHSALENGDMGTRHKNGRLFSRLGQGTPDSKIAEMWAIPGMTNYLLGHELTSDAMRQRKSQGILPTWDELNRGYYVPSYHLHPVFCNILSYLLSISASTRNTGTDQTYPFWTRSNALADAATRRALSWWADPYSRASIPQRVNCPDSPRKMWFLHMLFSYFQARFSKGDDIKASPTEVAPGLSVKDTLMIIASEECIAFTPQDHVLDKLSVFVGYSMFARERGVHDVRIVGWNERNFTVRSRAEVACALVTQFLLCERLRFRDQFGKRFLVLALFFPSLDASLWLKVVKEAVQQMSGRTDAESIHVSEYFKGLLKEARSCVKPSVVQFAKLFLQEDIPDGVVDSICDFTIEKDMLIEMDIPFTANVSRTHTWSHGNFSPVHIEGLGEHPVPTGN